MLRKISKLQLHNSVKFATKLMQEFLQVSIQPKWSLNAATAREKHCHSSCDQNTCCCAKVLRRLTYFQNWRLKYTAMLLHAMGFVVSWTYVCMCSFSSSMCWVQSNRKILLHTYMENFQPLSASIELILDVNFHQTNIVVTVYCSETDDSKF